MILGHHAIADIYGIENDALDDIEKMKKTILDSCKKSNLHVVEFTFHKFEPYGLSGICVLEESHFAIHTWPEHNFASIDAFTCGDKMDPSLACQTVANKLGYTDLKIKTMDRGVFNE